MQIEAVHDGFLGKRCLDVQAERLVVFVLLNEEKRRLSVVEKPVGVVVGGAQYLNVVRVVIFRQF